MLSRTQPRPKDTPEASLADLQHPIIEAYLAALPVGGSPASWRPEPYSSRTTARKRFAWPTSNSAGSLIIWSRSGLSPRTSLPELITTLDMHVGTPDDFIASLRADSTLDHVTDLIFQVHSVDPPHPLILRSIELTAKTVAPALGWEGPQARKGNRVALAT